MSEVLFITVSTVVIETLAAGGSVLALTDPSSKLTPIGTSVSTASCESFSLAENFSCTEPEGGIAPWLSSESSSSLLSFVVGGEDLHGEPFFDLESTSQFSSFSSITSVGSTIIISTCDVSRDTSAAEMNEVSELTTD